MRIAFVDKSRLDYTVDAPERGPLGGSQSAMVYLGREVVARGHRVDIYRPTGRQTSSGDGITVQTWPYRREVEHFADTDAVISINGTAPDRISLFDRSFRPTVARVLWPTVAPDQALIHGLLDERVRRSWDGYAMLSEWASQAYQAAFGVDPARCALLRNGVAPPFEHLFSASESILSRKSHAPLLVMTSAPFRGLPELLDAFPKIRSVIPDVRLRVYSGQSTYQVDPTSDPFASLYQRCRETPGVEYIGPVAQPELALGLREAWILAYPCTFPETSCIAVMEAMAAGCEVVTLPRAALPETMGGFGALLPSPRRERIASTFADGVIAALQARQADPVGTELRLRAQVQYLLAVGTWRDRAREWEEYLTDLCAWKRS